MLIFWLVKSFDNLQLSVIISVHNNRKQKMIKLVTSLYPLSKSISSEAPIKLNGLLTEMPW